MHDPKLQQAVLDTWFGAPDSDVFGHVRRRWFKKDPAFDAMLRADFASAIEMALAGRLATWSATAEGTLALILLLDQFARNCFRHSPRAYEGDRMALSLAKSMVASGSDTLMPTPFHRVFIYMPFEHDESPASQQEAVRLFTMLSAVTQDASIHDNLNFAKRHAEVVERFGRFPHRNAVLGRVSTPAEIAWLSRHGGF